MAMLRASFSLFVLTSLAGLSLAQKTPEVRLDVGSTPGSALSQSPQIASSGSSVYVAWEDWRNGLRDIYFNRSLDGGATWLATDVRLDTGSAPGASTSYQVQIAASGSSVHLTWSDFRNGSVDIYSNSSLDAGTTWLPVDVRLDVGSAPGTAFSDCPRIAASGASVYVTWSDGRDGFQDIYFNRSLDEGATWLLADVRLDVGSAPGTEFSGCPRIAASGGSVYVTWAEAREPLTDIYFNRSLDAGAIWLPAAVRLDVGSVPGAGPSYEPRIVASGSSVYVTWFDARSGQSDIYFNRSLDAGASWLSPDVRLDVGSESGAVSSYDPEIAASDASVYVSWVDQRNGESPDIYCNRSVDSGATWLSEDVRLDVGSEPGTTTSFHSRIAAEGSAAFVVWEDQRNGRSDVYFNRSLDAGMTWLPVDVRLDLGSAAGASNSSRPEIAASGASVYVTWEDTRNEASDIYFNLALGFQTYGHGTPGSGGHIPSISGSGNASIGGPLSIDLANGLGGALGLLALGFHGPASIPIDGGALLVQPALQLLPIRLGGAQGSPGAGSTSVPLPVPPNLSLIGTRTSFQARLLDPGASAGASLTGGLEAWIL